MDGARRAPAAAGGWLNFGKGGDKPTAVEELASSVATAVEGQIDSRMAAMEENVKEMLEQFHKVLYQEVRACRLRSASLCLPSPPFHAQRATTPLSADVFDHGRRRPWAQRRRRGRRPPRRPRHAAPARAVPSQPRKPAHDGDAAADGRPARRQEAFGRPRRTAAVSVPRDAARTGGGGQGGGGGGGGDPEGGGEGAGGQGEGY